MDIKLKVQGMHCTGCEANINDALVELEGVIKVKADFKKGEVRVHFDEKKINLDKIKEAIEGAGYRTED
ncbi:MAG: heavy-metal-associated domain-containing protein [Candidatus Goldbacteria bacterium]|nr:heavy-metal-associated domain-containing protein [Candidatus Goldiibacteriota bacterium]